MERGPGSRSVVRGAAVSEMHPPPLRRDPPYFKRLATPEVAVLNVSTEDAAEFAAWYEAQAMERARGFFTLCEAVREKPAVATFLYFLKRWQATRVQP